MKSKIVGTVWKSFLWVAITCSLAYSIEMLNANSARADDSCTPAECNTLLNAGPTICRSFNKGTFVSLECPVPSAPDFANVICSDGNVEGECGND